MLTVQKLKKSFGIFQDFQHQGRHINVEVTKKSAGKERSGGRKGGGFKGKDKGSRSFDKSSKGADKGRRRSSGSPSPEKEDHLTQEPADARERRAVAEAAALKVLSKEEDQKNNSLRNFWYSFP